MLLRLVLEVDVVHSILALWLPLATTQKRMLLLLLLSHFKIFSAHSTIYSLLKLAQLLRILGKHLLKLVVLRPLGKLVWVLVRDSLKLMLLLMHLHPLELVIIPYALTVEVSCVLLLLLLSMPSCLLKEELVGFDFKSLVVIRVLLEEIIIQRVDQFFSLGMSLSLCH